MRKVSSFLCEHDGKASSSRIVAMLMACVFIPVFVYYAFWKDRIVDIPSNMAKVVIGLYGVNRLSKIGVLNGQKNGG